MTNQLFFGVRVLQNLLRLSSIHTAVYVFVKNSFNRLILCIKSLLLTQKGHILHKNKVGFLELFFLAQLEATLKQNVVIDWEIDQKRAHIFEGRFGFQNYLFVTAKKWKIIVIVINFAFWENFFWDNWNRVRRGVSRGLTEQVVLNFVVVEYKSGFRHYGFCKLFYLSLSQGLFELEINWVLLVIF